eukprot:141-Chlamydomonas_euryale.AAC.1
MRICGLPTGSNTPLPFDCDCDCDCDCDSDCDCDCDRCPVTVGRDRQNMLGGGPQYAAIIPAAV